MYTKTCNYYNKYIFGYQRWQDYYENERKENIIHGNFFRVIFAYKNKLDSNGIKYLESTKKNDSWFRFLLQLFFIGTGSYGMNGEHVMHYCIYVETEDYDAASQLIKGLD